MQELNTNEQKQTGLETNTSEKGGIVVPVIMWWLGMPLLLVIVLWALFFRG